MKNLSSPSENSGASSGLRVSTGSAHSRKERAWKHYRESECFDSDGKANAFSKGFDAGETITPEKWNALLGERDHLLGVIREIQRIWQTESEACADNSRAGELMAKQARNGTAYLESLNAGGVPRPESAPTPKHSTTEKV